MQMLNAVTPNMLRLDRAYQNVARPADYQNQLATIRVVYGTNMDENGQLKTNIGAKTKDDVFTIRVEFLRHPRGLQSMKLTLPGSYAEQAVRDGLKKGDRIRFDAHVNGKLDEMGRLDRSPYLFALWYEKVTDVQTDVHDVHDIHVINQEVDSTRQL